MTDSPTTPARCPMCGGTKHISNGPFHSGQGQKRMACSACEKDYDKMRVCSHLLPDPGGEVVRELLDDIDELEAEVKRLVESMQLISGPCELTKFSNPCPNYMEPEPAWCNQCIARHVLESLGYPTEPNQEESP